MQYCIISLYIHIYIYIPIHTQKGRKGQLSECFLKNHPFPMCWMTWHHDICSCDGASQTKWLSDTRAKRKGWSLLKTDVILALRFGDRRLIGHLAAEQAGFSDGTSKSDVSKASFKWFWQTHIADCEIHILLSMEYLSSFVHFPVHLFQAGSFQKQICWKLLCLWWIW